MSHANLNDFMSDLPRLRFHAVHGEDVSADLAGLVARLATSADSADPTEWEATVRMIRARLRAQLELLDGLDGDRVAGTEDPVSTERAFYQSAIDKLDAALPHPVA